MHLDATLTLWSHQGFVGTLTRCFRNDPHNYRINPPAGGGLAGEGRPRSPAAGYAERWADKQAPTRLP